MGKALRQVTMAGILFPERDCSQCLDPDYAGGARQREQWGCEKDLPFATIVMDGEELLRCPRRPYLDRPEWFNDVYEAYRWYMRGHLPDTGGWTAQSPVLLRYIDIIERAQSDAEQAKAAKAARQPARGASGPPQVPRPRGR